MSPNCVFNSSIVLKFIYLLSLYIINLFTISNTSTFDIITILVPDIFIDFTNLS